MRVLIIGAGNMGRGIATRMLAGGNEITFFDVDRPRRRHSPATWEAPTPAREWPSQRRLGCGIALENLERIFDAFWQVEQGLTRRLGGTGLGLKLSREMARSLGGDLEVLSTFGQGSTFTVWLPLRHSELV
jgi:light-regulated signal transduction histidine kinase (bacteriophytochrome)